MTVWTAATLGGVKGSVSFEGAVTRLEAHVHAQALICQSLRLEAEDGKLGDAEDSFIFCYRAIDPSSENFRLSATVRASKNAGLASQQSGFGIMAVDTIASTDMWCAHRNNLLVGCWGRQQEFGVRLVAGYMQPDARELDGRRVLDERRRFSGVSPEGYDAAPHRLMLEKTDAGFRASCDGESIEVPGCDFLMRQDDGAIYVGFAVARGVTIDLSEIAFETSPGHASAVPEGTIIPCFQDYPFPRELLAQTSLQLPPASHSRAAAVYVSPNGTPDATGSESDPLDLGAALSRTAPGACVIMQDGVYELSCSLVIPSTLSGTVDKFISLKAEHSRKAVIDGRRLEGGQPLVVLDADFWHLEGVVFANGPLSGLTVCGSMNRVADCEAYRNGDTGILIISRPGAERADWPQRNMIENCDSHDNCDECRCNADGFGAKLRVGAGNVFYRCIAHHNIDDGFDLFSKNLYGVPEPVELDSCVAYCNGALSDGSIEQIQGGGIGFKLGGGGLPAAHSLWNCVAFSNDHSGFSTNTNPTCELHFCTAGANGMKGGGDYSFYSVGPGSWVREGLLRVSGDDALPGGGAVRMPDGSISLPAVLDAQMWDGKRIGASLDVRKRVLFFIDSLCGGGAERTACRLASALSKRHDVFIMYFSGDDGEAYPLDSAVTRIDVGARWPRAKGPRIKRLLETPIVLLKQIRLLKQVRKQHAIDTTVSLLSTPNLVNGLARGGRRVVCERNDPSRKPKRYQLRIAVSSKCADYMVFQTRKVKEMFDAFVQQKSCIIPNPVTISRRADHGKAKKIVAVGRLHAQKNYALLITAFARFHATHPEHTLHIFGRGSQEEVLRQLVSDLDLKDSVVFEGFCKDVHAAIADAQMYVLSSDYEGLSNALIEAMMMGLPCISTACTGSDELITDGVDGLLVPVGDAAALCEAMERLADDPALRDRISAGARMRTRDFDIEDVIRKWERIL